MNAFCYIKSKAAMPRGARSQGNSFASKLQCQANGPGRNSASVAVGSKAKTQKRQEVLGKKELPHCPLCIEKFDATELAFKPCPCGYKICLFCYDRISKEFNNLCPGCRTLYGSEQAPIRNGATMPARTLTRSATPTTQKHPVSFARSQTPHGQSQPPSQQRQASGPLPSRPPPATSAASWPSLAESAPAPQPPPQPKQSKPPPSANGFHQPGSAATDVTASSGELTHGDVCDGTTSASKSGSMGSESQDWPPLKSSTGRPGSRQQQGGSLESQGPLRSSMSGSIDLLSNPELIAPRMRGPKRGFQGTLTAEVVSIAGGSRKTVCVPIDFSNLPGGEKHPEGVASLGRTKKAVREGKISSTEGAVRLMSVLNKLEKQAGERVKPGDLKKSRQSNIRKNPASAKAAEGSGSVGVKTPVHHRSVPSLSHWGGGKPPERLEDTPSIIVDRPPVNASPISPPNPLESARLQGSSPFSQGAIDYSSLSQKAGDIFQNAALQQQQHQQSQQHSLWTDRGLPGIELQARQNLSTRSSPGISQNLTGVDGLASNLAQDIFRLVDSSSEPMFNQALNATGLQRGVRNDDLGFGFQQPTGPISIPTQQELNESMMGVVRKDTNGRQNGLTLSEMQYLSGGGGGGGNALHGMIGGSPNMMGSSPGMISGSPGMMNGSPGMIIGSPGMWMGGQQPEIPQYLPPDIAAARGVGLFNRSPQSVPPGMYRPFPVQNLPQQLAGMRIQEQAPGHPTGSRLLQNWK